MTDNLVEDREITDEDLDDEPSGYVLNLFIFDENGNLIPDEDEDEEMSESNESNESNAPNHQ